MHYINSKKAAEMLNIKITTLYKKTSANLIPFFKPGGKLMVFRVEDINDYIQNGKVESIKEIKSLTFKNLKNETFS